MTDRLTDEEIGWLAKNFFIVPEVGRQFARSIESLTRERVLREVAKWLDNNTTFCNAEGVNTDYHAVRMRTEEVRTRL